MFDALLYAYIVITNMKHVGHSLAVTAVLEQLKARCRPRRNAMMQMWKGTAAEATAGRSHRTARVSIVCPSQEQWTELLGRLETYVASIA